MLYAPTTVAVATRASRSSGRSSGPGRHLRIAQPVGVVGGELGEGLVGGAVVVGAGGGDEVQLGA